MVEGIGTTLWNSSESIMKGLSCEFVIVFKVMLSDEGKSHIAVPLCVVA